MRLLQLTRVELNCTSYITSGILFIVPGTYFFAGFGLLFFGLSLVQLGPGVGLGDDINRFGLLLCRGEPAGETTESEMQLAKEFGLDNEDSAATLPNSIFYII